MNSYPGLPCTSTTKIQFSIALQNLNIIGRNAYIDDTDDFLLLISVAPEPTPITSLLSHPPFTPPSPGTSLSYQSQHSCHFLLLHNHPLLLFLVLAPKSPYSPFSLFSNQHDVLISEVVVEVCEQCS